MKNEQVPFSETPTYDEIIAAMEAAIFVGNWRLVEGSKEIAHYVDDNGNSACGLSGLGRTARWQHAGDRDKIKMPCGGCTEHIKTHNHISVWDARERAALQRMKREYVELNQKTDKLQIAIADNYNVQSGLTESHRILMFEQHKAMLAYQAALNSRIGLMELSQCGSEEST